MKHRFEGYSRSTVSAAIDEWIFNERDRAILKRRLLDGICYEPLAEEFGQSSICTHSEYVTAKGTGGFTVRFLFLLFSKNFSKKC